MFCNCYTKWTLDEPYFFRVVSPGLQPEGLQVTGLKAKVKN